ncbi:hypothetical protein [Streptomyces sp. NPDC059814]|uniref:hypothetical protein n=1 Tax=Streptomyces sp. NPDC059814 TaxID=3346959 RepID=UPI003651E2DF
MGTDGTAHRENERDGKVRESADGAVHNDFRGAHFTHSQVQGSGVTNIASTTRRRRAFLVGSLTVALAVLVAMITWMLGADSPRDSDADGVASSTPAQSLPSAPASTPPASAPNSPAYPEYTPLDRQAVDRVFQEYFDALVSHDMAAFRRATCPQLRSTLVGFVLNNYYVARWKVLPYAIPAATDRFSVDVRITQQDPDSEELAGDVMYQWMVERDGEGNYWVCGWINW